MSFLTTEYRERNQRLNNCLRIGFGLHVSDDSDSLAGLDPSMNDVAPFGVWVGTFGTMRMSALSHDVLLSPAHAQDDTMCCFWHDDFATSRS